MIFCKEEKKKKQHRFIHPTVFVQLFEECNMDSSWPATRGIKPLMMTHDWNLSTHDTEAGGLPGIPGQSAPC